VIVHWQGFDIPYRNEGETKIGFFLEAGFHFLIQILFGIYCRYPQTTRIYGRFNIKDVKLRYRISRLIGNISRLIFAIYYSLRVLIILTVIDNTMYLIILTIGSFSLCIIMALGEIYVREMLNRKS
jgi:hypothetical protein